MDPAHWLWKKDPDFSNQASEETSTHLLLEAWDQRLGVEQDQLLCGSTGTSSGNCQEMETCMVWACHMSQQPLKKHVRAPWRVGSWGNAEWTTSKSGHPCPCQSCPQEPPAEKTGIKSLLNRLSCPPMTQSIKGPNWTELKKSNQIWNRVDRQRSEKRIQTQIQKKKKSFLIGRNRTKRANFPESPLFQAVYNMKNKQTNNWFNLSCVGWMLEAGRRKRAWDWPESFSFCQPPTPNWHKIS